MRILSETEYQQQAQPILRRVFVENEPYDQPFSPSITERVIVFPCDIYPELLLIDGLVAAASSVGDTGCYLTQLWRSTDKPNDCYIPLLELREAYYSNPPSSNKHIDRIIELFPEYVLYSAQGKWGLMASHERFGVLGGLPEFMEAVRQIVPNLDCQVYNFLENYQLSKAAGMHLTLDWLPGLLTHVYGQEAAEKMLQETELP